MDWSPVAVTAVLLCVLTSGCALAPPVNSVDETNDTGEATTDSYTPPEVNETLVQTRVEGLTGVEILNDPEVTYHPASEFPAAVYELPDEVQPVATVFALEPASPPENRTGVAGTVLIGGNVKLYAHENATSAETEVTLAHELYHVIQMYYERVPTLRSGQNTTFDRQITSQAIIEGAATYVMDRYHHRYVSSGPSPLAEQLQRVRTMEHTAMYLLYSPYSYGGRYVAARVDSARQVDRVYDEPPVTTEQLLHNETNATEPPRRLSTHVQPATGSTNWRETRVDTYGELLLRGLLQSELDYDRATEAATGWSTDRLHTFESTESNSTAIVWTVRMDDAANATDLEAALESYATRRGSQMSGTVSVDRVAPETVAVVAGPSGFVESSSLEGTNATVDLQVPAS